jgi:GT2 family glycosyltransferase
MLGKFSSKNMLKLSIVIITQNRQEKLMRSIASIHAKSDVPYEIIVVDNGSTLGIPKELRVDEKVKLIENSENMGVAFARNQGFAASQGEYLMILDDDAYLHKGSLKLALEHFEKDKHVGIIGPKMIFPSGENQESARPFPNVLMYPWRLFGLHRVIEDVPWHRSYTATEHEYAEPIRVEWVLGACQIFPKKLLAAIGKLDESFFYGYEDVEWCKRAGEHGFSTVYFPSLIVIHDYAQTSKRKPMSKQGYEHFKSLFKYFLK